MKGKTSYVQYMFDNTINKRNVTKAHTVISGIGINGEKHLGLKLLLLGDLSRGTYIDCDFQILKSGNAYNDLEKYVKNKKVVNLQILNDFKDKYFKQEFFTLDSNLSHSPIRYGIGEKALIIARNNKGRTVPIVKVEKYPDDPELDKGKFGAYYVYELGGKLYKKKDENLA